MIRCVCGMTFSSDDEWARHVATVHKGEPDGQVYDYDYQAEEEEEEDYEEADEEKEDERS
jgi:hypothetical protein